MVSEAGIVQNRLKLNQRLAVIRRLKEMLSLQREKLRDFLLILENEEKTIIENDMEKLASYVHLEKTILYDIHTLQKVIKPLEEMAGFQHQPDMEISELQDSLGQIELQLILRQRRNKELLRQCMEKCQKEIHSLKIPQTKKAGYQEPVSRFVSLTR